MKKRMNLARKILPRCTNVFGWGDRCRCRIPIRDDKDRLPEMEISHGGQLINIRKVSYDKLCRRCEAIFEDRFKEMIECTDIDAYISKIVQEDGEIRKK